MKVLILEDIADPNKGGAEKSMYEFVKLLCLQGCEVSIACKEFNYPRDSGIKNKFLINGTSFQLKNTQLLLSDIMMLKSVIRKERIDFILTHTIHNFPLLAILKKITKVKLYVIFKWIYNEKSVGIKSKWGLNSVDKSIFLNEFVADYWLGNFSKKKPIFRIIPDGIKINTIERRFPEKFKKILFVGRITEGKGVHILLEVIKELSSDFSLTIVGDFRPIENSYHRSLLKYVNDKELNNKVQFVGSVSNNSIFDFYDDAELLIVPSILPEAQPLVIIESVMRGKPIICSKIGGLKYMIPHTDFWFFNKNEPIDIVRKINELNQLDKIQLDNHFNELRSYLLHNYDVNHTNRMALDFLKLGPKK